MLNSVFGGLFDTASQSVISVTDFLLCLGVSLVLGLALALCYKFRNRSSKSFSLAIALLPAAVCVVIMLVNGNIGAGVAVAGAFGLVRFRSAPGSAKEIVAVFMAMGAGLIAGMGYLGYAALFTLILGAAFIVYNLVRFGEEKGVSPEKTLRVTIPEDLNYTSVFDEVFGEYTAETRRVSVKTTNMGSMFKIRYDVTMKPGADEKAFMDALRLRNGNLEIVLNERESANNEL